MAYDVGENYGKSLGAPFSVEYRRFRIDSVTAWHMLPVHVGL